MANSIGHGALPYPVKGCRYTVLIPFLDADGDPLDPTTPDTERSIDGAAFADCTEEATTITGANGMGYITLTGDELNASLVAVAAKVASGPKATLLTIAPRVLPIAQAGTAQAGGASTITLDSGASAYDKFYIGCIVRTTGGTGGGGGSGSLNNQARVITDYVGSTKVATVSPAWETNPSATTTYEVLLTAEAKFVYGQVGADVLLWRGVQPSSLVSGQVLVFVTGLDAAVITAAAIATDAIGSAELAASAITEIQAGLATAAALATVQGDTDDIQTRLPAALVGGRVDASVGAMAADVITAAAIATDAIGAAELAASAAQEIADAILQRDISAVEAAAAVKSLATAILKSVSRVRDNAGTLQTFQTDGVTVKMSQAITTDAADAPIDELGVGS